MIRVWYRLVDPRGKPYKQFTTASLLVDENSIIDDVRTSVRAENPNKLASVDATDLKVYRDQKAFESGSDDLSVAYAVSNIQTTSLDNPLFVLVPESSESSRAIMEIVEKAFTDSLLGVPSSSQTSRNRDFKANLIKYYDCDIGMPKDSLRCMLLNIGIPRNVVIASHLFRSKHDNLCEDLLKFSDIDDVKNGLLLFKPIEHAFDHFQISFLWSSQDNQYHLKLWDTQMQGVRLVDTIVQDKTVVRALKLDKLPNNWRQTSGPALIPNTQFDAQTTFGDIDGLPLIFTNMNRPFARCLNFQARLARVVALRDNPDKSAVIDFVDHWSDFDSNATVGDWLKTFRTDRHDCFK